MKEYVSLDLRRVHTGEQAREYLGLNRKKNLENFPETGLARLANDSGVQIGCLASISRRWLASNDYPLGEIALSTIRLARFLAGFGKRREEVLEKIEHAYRTASRRRKLAIPDFQQPAAGTGGIQLLYERIIPQITGEPYIPKNERKATICQRTGCEKEVPEGKIKYCSDNCRRIVNRDISEARARRKTAAIKEQHGGKTATRTCLSCNHNFLSEGPWNRICPRCSERNTAVPLRAIAVPIDPEYKRYFETLEKY